MTVVEIQSGVVSRCFPLEQELPQTEWLSGEIHLRNDADHQLRAYYQNKLIE
jgi:hypothetical protein